jgi:hypothetical protein
VIPQAGDPGGHRGRLQQQRLAGGQRLDLGVGQRGGVDVLDLAGRQLAGEDLGGGAVKAHGHRLHAAASLQNGDRVHQPWDVLLDEHAPEAAAGDRRATAEAQPGGKAVPQRRMAVALELMAGPEAGLDLEQRHRDPARDQDRGGHRRPPQWASHVALISFAVLEVGADGRG